MIKELEDKTLGFQPASADADNSSPDELGDSKESVLTYLDKLISEKPIKIEEENFVDDADQPVREIEDGRGGRKLVFDKKTAATQEKNLIKKFLDVFDSAPQGSRKAAFVNGGTDADGFNIKDEFGWFFEEEDESFFVELAERIRARFKDLESGVDVNTLASAGLGNIDEAMNFFRSKSHRRLIKESLSEQTQQLPILGFKAKKTDGSYVDMKYNPADLNDPNNEVDIMYVNADDGKQELIITFNNPDYIDIAPIIKPENGKFKISQGGFSEKEGLNDRGELEKWWSIDVKSGENTKDPIFSRIRVVRKSIDLDKELDDYLTRKTKEEERKNKATYKSQTPTAAATPTKKRFAAANSTSYVRSG